MGRHQYAKDVRVTVNEQGGRRSYYNGKNNGKRHFFGLSFLRSVENYIFQITTTETARRIRIEAAVPTEFGEEEKAEIKESPSKNVESEKLAEVVTRNLTAIDLEPL